MPTLLRSPLRAMLLYLVMTMLLVAPHIRAQTAPPLRRAEVRADDGHRLVLWAKRPSGPARGELVLLHGRTWSALPNFDLQVRGQQVSLMDALVARGYAVYALDQRGYGATTRDTTGWLTPERAARDAEAVVDWVATQSPRSHRPALFGYSRGAATAMLAAQRHPEKLSALVLYGFYFNTANPPALDPPARVPLRARTTAAGAEEDFISPDSTPAGVKDAYVKAATSSDPVRADWRREEQFNALDPAKVRTPTLVINGERDPYALGAGLPAFMATLGTVDRWWIVLSHADHAAHLERQTAFVNALVGFLQRADAPARR